MSQYQYSQGGGGSNKTLLIVGLGAAGCFGLIVIGIIAIVVGLAFVGSNAPPTYIIPGREVKQEYRDEMKDLNILNNTEKILYLYANGFSINEGTYALTTENLIIHSKYDSPTSHIIPISDVILIQTNYNTDFWIDSDIYVTTKDGEEYYFPLSSEFGTDRKFIKDLSDMSGAHVEDL